VVATETHGPQLGSGLRVADHMSAQVWQVPATATLLEVADLLATRRISCAVVTEGERPVGIISERDIVREVARDPAAWAQRSAGTAMTQPVHVGDPGWSVAEAIGTLRRFGIRRLPVVGAGGRLVGIITQTDLLRAAHASLEEYARNLERLVAERTTALRDSEQQRNDLVDLTVHDIKNWLHAAHSTVEMLSEDPAEAIELLPVLRRATRSIGNLVSTLLDINRLESGWMPFRLSETPCSSLCEPMVQEAAVMARTKAVNVEWHGERHVIVRCDPELVERVLLNLLDNAVSAAPARTTIDVHTGIRADGALVVRVGNRGPVIAPEVLPTLFRKYHQGVDRVRGWGLGLTFCRLAIEHHGGTIRAISPYVDGEGTAFEFTLPPQPSATRHVGTQPRATAASPAAVA
jgi:signal transduction histidine kinase